MDDNEFRLLMLMERFCLLGLGTVLLLIFMLGLAACSSSELNSDVSLDQSDLPCERITFADGILISCSDHSLAWIEEMFGWSEHPEDPLSIVVTVGTSTRQDFAYELDPCGDGPGEDQVIYKFYDGRYAAWAETGLVILEPGLHYTSDQQRCKFLIKGNGAIKYFYKGVNRIK